jgi:hypothetical protein
VDRVFIGLPATLSRRRARGRGLVDGSVSLAVFVQPVLERKDLARLAAFIFSLLADAHEEVCRGHNAVFEVDDALESSEVLGGEDCLDIIEQHHSLLRPALGHKTNLADGSEDVCFCRLGRRASPRRATARCNGRRPCWLRRVVREHLRFPHDLGSCTDIAFVELAVLYQSFDFCADCIVIQVGERFLRGAPQAQLRAGEDSVADNDGCEGAVYGGGMVYVFEVSDRDLAVINLKWARRLFYRLVLRAT